MLHSSLLDPEEIAKAALPKTYRITSSRLKDGKELKFFVLGCQGKSSKQKKVAELMNEIAADPANKPDFILLLGDNFYDFGVDDCDDPAFDPYFYQMYTDPKKVPHLAGIPCFPILGNHDENLHGKNFILSEKGIQRGLHQVAHTYTANQFGTTSEKINVYNSNAPKKETILDLDTLQPWNMPSGTYSLLYNNDQIFCIDSNTYFKDFLEYCILGDKTSPANQARWLAEEVEKAKNEGRNVMLALHHPLITPGKRAYTNDSGIYFNKDDLLRELDKDLAQDIILHAEKLFPGIFSKGYPYNHLLFETLKLQRLEFNTVFNAHDHNMYYINNSQGPKNAYQVCQIGSGGGGGGLQTRTGFEDQENMGCFLHEHGVVSVTCGKPNKFTIHTLEQRNHLEFTSDNCLPTRIYSGEAEDTVTKKFCSMIQRSLDAYFNFIGQQQKQNRGKFLSFTTNISHGIEGVQRANELWAYISNFKADSLYDTVDKVCSTVLNTGTSQHSLFTIIDRECKKEFGFNLERFKLCVPRPN